MEETLPALRLGAEFELLIELPPSFPHTADFVKGAQKILGPVWDAEKQVANMQEEKTRAIKQDLSAKGIDPTNDLVQKELLNRLDDREIQLMNDVSTSSKARRDALKVYLELCRKVIAAWIKARWDAYKQKSYVKMDIFNELAGGKRDYSKWNITDDDAVTYAEENSGKWFPFEFVGPILEISSVPSGRADAQTTFSPARWQRFQQQNLATWIYADFFEFLTGNKDGQCGLTIHESNISTSTHFHVSLAGKDSTGGDKEWQLEDVKRIYRSAYLWDPCIRYLLPVWRRLRTYAGDTHVADTGTANFFNFPLSVYRETTFAEGRFPRCQWDDPSLPPPYLKVTRADVVGNFNQIDACTSVAQLVDIQQQRRNAGWNLTNIGGHKNTGTIEFRRPSGSYTWSEAVAWLEFTYAFFTAALTRGGRDDLIILLDQAKLPKELTNVVKDAKAEPNIDQGPTMALFRAWLEIGRFERSLQVGRYLDAKFDRATQHQEDMRLYMSLQDEAALRDSRQQYLDFLLKSGFIAKTGPRWTRVKFTDQETTQLWAKSPDQRFADLEAGLAAGILAQVGKMDEVSVPPDVSEATAAKTLSLTAEEIITSKAFEINLVRQGISIDPRKDLVVVKDPSVATQTFTVDPGTTDAPVALPSLSLLAFQALNRGNVTGINATGPNQPLPTNVVKDKK